MPTGILGKKVGMTRILGDDGTVTPLTLVECEPNVVAALKEKEKAVVLGAGPRKRPTKTKKFYHLKQFALLDGETLKVGDTVTLEQFKDVKEVTAIGTSKGKGFAGFIKRHHFSSGPGSHGSHAHREPGSIGARAKPGRVHKGKRMAGRLGGERVTIKHVKIADIDPSKNLIALKGALPGAKGSLVIIKQS